MQKSSRLILICYLVALVNGTQGIVSVNFLSRRPLILFDFLKRVVTSNFHDMRNLMSAVFGLLKMSF